MGVLNPPAELLGRQNAIVSGRARSRGHFVPPYAGPLSIKTVLDGEAIWRTQEATFRVEPSQILILNGGHQYTLTIEPSELTETLCAFFKDGFVEDIRRNLVEPDIGILDDPDKPQTRALFVETLRPALPRVRGDLLRLRAAIPADGAGMLKSDEIFGRLASEMLQSEADLRGRAASVPAARPSTRSELMRRLLRARDFIEAELCETLELERIARAACLSPYHCHRLFVSFFRETPLSYVTRRRLERAQALLARGMPVTDVCVGVGFTSVGSFSNLFRRHFGIPPSAYGRHEKSKAR
jgi:AraC-like DNA-binding protein